MPRFAEAGHLIAVGIVQAGLGLAVGALLASLFRLTRQRYLAYWSLAWIVLSVRSAAGTTGLLLGLDQVAGRAFGVLGVFVEYLQAPALALAASSLRSREPGPTARRILLGGSMAAGAVLVGLASVLPLSLPGQIVLAVVPSYALVVAANAWFAWSFARYSPRARTAAGRLVVGFSVAYAVHLSVVGMGWAGVDLYAGATAPAVIGLLLPMGITAGIVASVIQDATEAERRLRRSEATQGALIEAIPDTLFVLDRELVFREYQPAKGFEPLVPPALFLGRRVSDVMPPGLAGDLERCIARALETGGAERHEYALPGPDGPAYYEARLSPSLPDRVIAIVRDVTRQKRAESEREALIAELAGKNVELAAKNAELERFTYTVSHDLKSPLVTILGFLGYAERALAAGDAEAARGDLDRIRSAASKMQGLLRDLLELSRIGRVAGPPREVPVEELVREVVLLLDERVRQGRVDVQIEDGLPTVCGDPVRLREVFQNLLENATRFTAGDDRTRVTIGTRGRDPDGLAVLFVRDDGLGIDPSHHERIFGLFEKLDPASEGTGIGLTVARRIVEVHGGRMWVESEGHGRGSTFCFTLPAARDGSA
ncbi:MAG TPA: ATP-binding protein [Vicinamibacteria bacterium]|nr:ATP-binding protein [Vicinamibacteria bacterium]